MKKSPSNYTRDLLSELGITSERGRVRRKENVALIYRKGKKTRLSLQRIRPEGKTLCLVPSSLTSGSYKLIQLP